MEFLEATRSNPDIITNRSASGHQPHPGAAASILGALVQ
jgi:hypothetical protein